MPIIIDSAPKPYELPDEGEHVAVLADVEDRGVRDTKYGSQFQVRLWFLVDQKNSNGKHIKVTRTYNKSLNETSSLRKDVKSILGNDPGYKYDIEKLIGLNVRLVIEHQTREGRTFAGVAAILKPAKGGKVLTIPNEFVRAQTKNTNGTTTNATAPTPLALTPAPTTAPPTTARRPITMELIQPMTTFSSPVTRMNRRGRLRKNPTNHAD